MHKAIGWLVRIILLKQGVKLFNKGIGRKSHYGFLGVCNEKMPQS